MVTKLELKAYFHAVKKNLVYVPGKGQIIKDLRHEMESYLEQNVTATMEDVYRLFGAPESMADQVISAMSQEQIEKNTKRVKLVRTVAVLTAVVIFVMVVLTLAGIVHWNYNHQPIYFDFDIISQ